MKRALLLCLCVVLCGAMTANADGVFGTFTKGAETVVMNYARTASTISGIDLITLRIQSMTGTGTYLSNGMVNEDIGNPTFTGLTSSDYMYIYDDPDGEGMGKTVTSAASSAVPASYMNFDAVSANITGTLKAGVPAQGGGYIHAYSTWSAAWFSTSVTRGVGNLYGRIYVPTGGGFSMTGGVLLNDANVLMGAGSTGVPEPGTLALLASGLVGLLAYAWRKRK
jgi:hypothetical protein